MSNFNFRTFFNVLISILPTGIVFILTENVIWLEYTLISCSLYVVFHKYHWSVTKIILQWILILSLFSVIYFLSILPIYFALFTSFLAAISIGLSEFNQNLRTLSSFIIIPTFYCAFSFSEYTHSSQILTEFYKIILFSPCSLIGIFLILSVNGVIPFQKKRIDLTLDFSKNKEPFLIIFTSIFVAILLGNYFIFKYNLPGGQWVLWSIVSVANNNVSDTKDKLKHRVHGVILGSIIGFILCLTAMYFVVNIPILGYIIALLTPATLLIQPYILAFTSRCLFITLSGYLIDHSFFKSFERITDVLLGGFIGLIITIIVYYIYSFFKKKTIIS